MTIRRIRPRHHAYTAGLADIPSPPDQLYVWGQLPDQRRPTVAIVGSRRPTAYGREVTHRLASHLARAGVVVVSGLALGVDGLAHRAALEAGGTTIAVLATSLPTIYPARHRGLAEQIVAAGGAIMCEHDQLEGRAYQFLQRNRLVSGLADAVIITEAAARSGTLNTASHALAQGRDVCVVPGNITSPLSVGCNRLIQAGATPILDPDDVLALVAPQALNAPAHSPVVATNPDEAAILTLIQSGLRDGDEIQRRSGLDTAAFMTALTMLEINGTIRPLGGNQWTLA